MHHLFRNEITACWVRDEEGVAKKTGSSLLRTCKLIHNEALPEMHARTDLFIDCDPTADPIDYVHSTVPRPLDSRDQLGFLGEIAWVTVWFLFDPEYQRERCETEPMRQIFDLLNKGRDARGRLAINFESYGLCLENDDDQDDRDLWGIDFPTIIELFRGLRCKAERRVVVAFEGWGHREKGNAMLAAANAYVRP
ncbi:hypothetical protein LTR85_000699 [Meristemomyces frigidus]|nr:hypothetical protein LTR85_000699 [Meristemomyces frigidus]